MNQAQKPQQNKALLPNILYGGTFDPPHRGHVAVITYLLSQNIQRLFVVPTSQNPLKDVHATPIATRKKLVLEAFKNFNLDHRFSLYFSEMETNKPSYTIHTLLNLKKQFNGPFNLILGNENLSNLPRWKDSFKLLEEIHELWILPRISETPALTFSFPETFSETSKLDWNNVFNQKARPLTGNFPNISSTKIREILANPHSDEQVLQCIQRGVWELIKEFSIYSVKSN